MDTHVLIVGAGVTGLLIAQGLKKAGIKYTIFEGEEKTDHRRTRDWGFTIHWSRPLLESLLPSNLVQRISEAQVDPAYDSPYDIPWYNAKTGDLIKTLPLPGNAIRLSRRRLRLLLCCGLEILFGKKLTSTRTDSTGVSVYFEDGTVFTGSIVIGADGPHSTIRKSLFQEVEGSLDLFGGVMYNFTVCYGDREKALAVRKLHPINFASIHPELGLQSFISILEIPDPNAPETWIFQVFVSLRDGKSHLPGLEGLAEIKEIAHSLSNPWKLALLWIPKDAKMTLAPLSSWIAKPWNNNGGKITLAGDAIHPMPPHRGQGLNTCIADAANFVQAMASISEEKSAADVINAYDAEMIRRGGGEVKTSMENCIMVHDFEKFMAAPVFRQGYDKAEEIVSN